MSSNTTPITELAQHPESTCQKCGGINPVWSAENGLFNQVNGSPNGIMCPICFHKMATEKGIEVFFSAAPQVTHIWKPEDQDKLWTDISIVFVTEWLTIFRAGAVMEKAVDILKSKYTITRKP